jgi:hypothetical protein
MHALFSRICELEASLPSSEDSHETLLTTGKAISPLDAGRCVLDFARTAKFLRGVRVAIDEAQSRFPGETTHVLYAGCGPFAPLVLPLATVLKTGQAQFTLLDIHRRSLRHVRRIVEALGLSSFVRRYVQCDATVYDHGHESPMHVLVIETMQKALAKEPQVAIAMNLVPQMSEKGILIPERITLTAALADVNAEILGRPTEGEAPEVLDGSEARRQRVILGVPFELSAESARVFGRLSFRDASSGTVCLPARTVQTRPPSSDTQHLAVLTTITVLDPIVIGDYESGLTYPTFLPERDPTADSRGIPFVYRLGQEPGLAFRVFTVQNDAWHGHSDTCNTGNAGPVPRQPDPAARE